MGPPFSIVLVEPSESLNIGSVSRSMGNFNFTDLRIVSPQNFNYERALITACGATKALENHRKFDSLAEALADCQEAVGFSARSGKNRGQIVSLPDWCSTLAEKPVLKTALVFGPEDNGLRQEHVELCSSLVHIPTSSEYPSMNLAQAVTLALYNISLLSSERNQALDQAELRDYQQLDLLVTDVANASGFFHKGTPQPVPSVVKTIFRRLQLSKREMAIMLGLFGTTQKALFKRDSENKS